MIHQITYSATSHCGETSTSRGCFSEEQIPPETQALENKDLETAQKRRKYLLIIKFNLFHTIKSYKNLRYQSKETDRQLEIYKAKYFGGTLNSLSRWVSSVRVGPVKIIK